MWAGRSKVEEGEVPLAVGCWPLVAVAEGINYAPNRVATAAGGAMA